MPLNLTKRKGSPHWYIRGTYLGVRVFESTGVHRKPVARAKLQEIERRIEKGGAASKGTFSDAYLAYLKARPEQATYVKPLLQHFRETPLIDIDAAAIEACADTLYPNGKPGTINRNVLTPLAAILHHAAYLKLCPYIKVRKRKEPRGRDAVLTKEQADALLAASSDQCRAITLFMLTTGARAGEAIKLTWADVDLTRAHATLRDTKNGETYGVYLHESVVADLANLREDDNPPKDSEPVFGYTYKNRKAFNKDFQAACEAAGVPYGRYGGITPHSLRHTFATWLRQQKWDLKAVMALGRWKDINSVQRYAHVSSDEQRTAIDGLLVRNPCSGPESEGVQPVEKVRKAQ